MCRLKQYLLAALMIVMTGCTVARPPTIYTGLPDLPVHIHCLYEPYLTCLSAVLEAQGVQELDVLIGGFGDMTLPPNTSSSSPLSGGGAMMVSTGLAKLAPRIHAITPTAVSAGRKVRLVKGGFTELDRTISSAALGLGFRLALGRIGIDLSLDGDITWNVVTLDIQLAEPDGRQLPGIATALSVLVNSKTLDSFLLVEDDKGTFAASAAGKMKAVGRFHGAQRLLLYAGLYWVFSRYFGIDGKACVDIAQADVASQLQLVETYRRMSEQERITAIQRLLQEQGFLLETDGLLGPITRRAIRLYQASQGEIVTGQLSAPLFLKLHRTEPQVSKGKQGL